MYVYIVLKPRGCAVQIDDLGLELPSSSGKVRSFDQLIMVNLTAKSKKH